MGHPRITDHNSHTAYSFGERTKKRVIDQSTFYENGKAVYRVMLQETVDTLDADEFKVLIDSYTQAEIMGDSILRRSKRKR